MTEKLATPEHENVIGTGNNGLEQSVLGDEKIQEMEMQIERSSSRTEKRNHTHAARIQGRDCKESGFRWRGLGLLNVERVPGSK